MVGRIVSNFLGTTFNAYITDEPYKKYQTYPINTSSALKAVTVQYEMNLFGLKGPRKMTAFVPVPGLVVKEPSKDLS